MPVSVGIHALALTLAMAGACECRAASLCPNRELAVRDMVSTEYAFAAKAKESIRSAFLAYLAPDALVLQPYPKLGVPAYAAAKETQDVLEWYPTVAEVAASADLGFTVGPWTFVPADGSARTFGYFLTLWRRDALCAWHVQLDGGVSGAPPAVADTPLTPANAVFGMTDTPPGALITANALNHAVEDFQHVAQGSGAAAALRTYGHNGAVRLYIDGLPPIDGGGAVSEYLAGHPVKGVWKEMGHGRSGDATLAYSTGEVYDAKTEPTLAYVQIWVFDPKVANWGLRLLLLSRIAPR